MNGATGLYAGEQDMFCFLIDPTGWTEIQGESFAPGFFLWNSEVGRRSLGIQTFWFQAVCQNHIVWDAVEIAEFTRKHTANVHNSLGEIRRIVEQLAARRDERRDGFARVVGRAMQERLGADAEESLQALLKNGISRSLAIEALEIAKNQGRFTIFSLVDALTRATQKARFAGERAEADAKVSSLLALAL
jgi:histone H3/H4